MSTVLKFWRMDSVPMCLDFIKSLRFGEKRMPITGIKMQDGTMVLLEDASDDQIKGLARALSDMYHFKQVGKKKCRFTKI